MSAVPTIRRDSASYRQGLVLGLTMAETMLLLVFCLLMAAAIVFTRDRAQLKETQEAHRALSDAYTKTKSELRDAQRSIALMRNRIQDSEINDDWQRIVENAASIDKLEKAGISIKEAADAAPFISQLLHMHKDGVAADDVTGSIALDKAIKKEFAATPGAIPQPEDIPSLVRLGMQTKAAARGAGKHDWPPIITLSEADGKYFDTGSAVLSREFRAALSGPVIEQLLGIIKDYPDVNVIEVVGHTDEQPLVRRPSNLDEALNDVLLGRSPISRLAPADNAGLGLARAVSVTQVLMQDERLTRSFSIIPYSAAQLVDGDDTVSLTPVGGDVRERRRIEIRLRKSDKIRTLPVSTPPKSTRSQRPSTAAIPPTSQVNTAAEQSEQTATADPTQTAPPAPTSAPTPFLKSPFSWIFRN